MDFQTGDRVVHCTHGLGKVLAIEKRTFNNRTSLYYMIEVADLTVWVPADENLKNRLRPPTSKPRFRELLSILSSPADELPSDHRQRGLLLMGMLKDGQADTLCKVIRDLSAYRRDRSWNEYDNALMKRMQKALIGEWSFALSVTPQDAEAELHRLLAPKAN
jgi:CarD family transcriptional regulator